MQSNKFKFHSSTYIKFANLDTKTLIRVINHHINSINNPQKALFSSSYTHTKRVWVKMVTEIDLGVDATLSLRHRLHFLIGFRFIELHFRWFERFGGALGRMIRRFRGGEDLGLLGGGGAVWCFSLRAWNLLSLSGLVALLLVVLVLRRHWSGSPSRSS